MNLFHFSHTYPMPELAHEPTFKPVVVLILCPVYHIKIVGD
jgi:hypothetical protein